MGFKTKILDHTHEMTEAKFPGGKLLEKLLIACYHYLGRLVGPLLLIIVFVQGCQCLWFEIVKEITRMVDGLANFSNNLEFPVSWYYSQFQIRITLILLYKSPIFQNNPLILNLYVMKCP